MPGSDLEPNGSLHGLFSDLNESSQIMSRHKSASEVRAEHLTHLGPELGPIYHSLWNECAWLHVKWQEYEELYGRGPERVEIQNRAGATFFRITQDALWEAILLQLCALTDPKKTLGKENLTINAIPGLLENSQLRTEIESLAKSATEATGFARDWRNRRIAHRDLALSVGEGAMPLAEASRVHVSKAIRGISEVLRQISLSCLDSDMAFGMVPATRGGVDVLFVLRDGIHLENLRRKRMDEGNYDLTDLESPDPI